MWIEILCGLVFYKFIRRCFVDDYDDTEESHSRAILSVASRLEKLYGGKAYVGLRIPDADTGSRLNIDIVLISKGKSVVIAVKNMAGSITVNADGSWDCMNEHRSKKEHHEDPVAETRRQASVLSTYLEQRGVALPEGYLSHQVILPNPELHSLNLEHFPAEVMTYDQWAKLKPESKIVLSGWFKSAFKTGKEMQESFQQQLNYVLSTAPMWDRLEAIDGKYIFGEFVEFKGKHEDMQALQYIKRSKVGQLTVQNSSFLGFGCFRNKGGTLLFLYWLGCLCTGPTKIQVLYSLRDYRTESSSTAEWKEVNVRSSTEIAFLPQNSRKVRKFKLHAVSTVTLSA